eukprot:gene31998-33925_t
MIPSSLYTPTLGRETEVTSVGVRLGRVLGLRAKWTSNSELEAGNTELEAGNTELEAGNAELEAGNAELEAGNAELEAGNAEATSERRTQAKVSWKQGNAERKRNMTGSRQRLDMEEATLSLEAGHTEMKRQTRLDAGQN